MNAYLFKVKRYYDGEQYPTGNEFIVVGNVGCIFRGGSTEENRLLTQEEVDELRESILYLMDQHRGQGDMYYFVGSNWRLRMRLRIGKIKIFEANSIELAADLVQLHFLSQDSETTLTEWCCPIYVT